MPYFVYIIFNNDLDVFYKGFTENLEKRILEHNAGRSNFTSRSNNWSLVYCKEFPLKSLALIEERRIKKLNRMSILKLINT